MRNSVQAYLDPVVNMPTWCIHLEAGGEELELLLPSFMTGYELWLEQMIYSLTMKMPEIKTSLIHLTFLIW